MKSYRLAFAAALAAGDLAETLRRRTRLEVQLFRSDDPRLIHSGIVAGMSGSGIWNRTDRAPRN